MAEHEFDAGTRGCNEGLARTFREQLSAVPPGDTLRFVVSDPVARVEIPALARLLGHRVLSVAEDGDRITITVEATP